MNASILETACVEMARRRRQLGNVLSTDGFGGVVNRVRAKAADWIRPRGLDWPVFPDDVIAADLSRPPVVRARKAAANGTICVNWIMSPPGIGSGECRWRRC